MKNRTFLLIVLILLLAQSAWIYYLVNDVSKVEITKKEETNILEESDFIKKHIKDIQSSVLYVFDLNTKKQGSAIALTSDGLVLTLNSNVPKGDDFDFKISGNSKVYEIRKRDYNNDLALVQIGEIGLRPCLFAKADKIDLGDNVYVLGSDEKGSYIFGQGNIKRILENEIETDIIGDPLFNGAPVFDKEGAILGIAKLNQNNLVDVILIKNIKDFIDL